MAGNEETISAFAAYSGMNVKLSKKQKRRKQQKARKENAISQISDEFNETTMNENNKKRKNIEDSQDKNKKKKPKYERPEVKVQERSIKIRKSSRYKNDKSSEIKESCENLQNSTNSLTNLIEKSQSYRNKVKEKLKSHQLKKINPKQLTSPRKKKTNFKISHSEENPVSTETVLKKPLRNKRHSQSTNKINYQSGESSNGHFLNNISQDKLVGKLHLSQPCEPTLISKLEKMNNHSSALKSSRKIVEKSLDIQKSSIESGEGLFEELLTPFGSSEFFKNFWERTPLYVPGESVTKFSSLLSTQQIDDFLRNQVVMFGKHIDITSYKNGKRETHNLEGRALPHVVWDLYNHKCSVRLLCPQAAFNNIFAMNSKLQDYFGCFVGANVYLTPPNSQGFAPHYDDIEAFVLQVEGKKRWKIYSPRNKYETLPRYSSKNFNETEVGKPILEVTLNPGDFLYFPRGFIHQADTCDNVHSLHITVSVYQKNSWADLLEKAIPIALSKAAKEDVDFRRGLPLNYLRQAGIAYHSVSMRKQLIKTVKEKMLKLVNYLDIDSAVDMMGMQYTTDALPPVLSYDEASRSIFGNGLKMKNNGHVCGSISFSIHTKVRFTKAMCHRLIKEMVKSEDGSVMEEEEFRLYYSIDNSLEYHGEDPQFLVIPEEYVPAIKILTQNYPAFTRVGTLPLPALSEQARLVGDLWDRGLLVTDKPLPEGDVVIESDEEEEEIGDDTEVGDYDARLNGIDSAEIEESESETDIGVHKRREKEITLSKIIDSVEDVNIKDLDEEMGEEESDKEDSESFREYEKAIDDNKQYIRDEVEQIGSEDVYLEHLATISVDSSSSCDLEKIEEDKDQEYESVETDSSEDTWWKDDSS